MSGELRWRHVPTTVNAQPAVGCYTWNPQTRGYDARVLDVLTLREASIAAVTSFLDPAVFPQVGLPDRLPA